MIIFVFQTPPALPGSGKFPSFFVCVLEKQLKIAHIILKWRGECFKSHLIGDDGAASG
jgi:hypothetical protein